MKKERKRKVLSFYKNCTSKCGCRGNVKLDEQGLAKRIVPR